MFFTPFLMGYIHLFSGIGFFPFCPPPTKTILFRFGKITKRDMLKKKDKDGQSVAEKMMLDEIMRGDEEQRVEETIRMLQDYLSRGRKYSRFV